MDVMNRLQPWLHGKTAKIILSLIGIILIAFVWAFLFSNGISALGKHQLAAIKKDNLEKAYAMTSPAFQEKTSFEQFKAFVDKFPILRTYKRVRFMEERVDKEVGYLYGKLIANDGNKHTIEYQLVKHDHVWQIQALRLAPASSDDDDPVADSTGASIHSIFVNDTADANGYTEQGKKILNKNAKIIYATVQVVAPTTGIEVSATLVNVASGSKIGPSSGEITKPGNVLKAFSFTRDKQLWPVGEYEIDISLSTGATKSIRFKVD